MTMDRDALVEKVAEAIYENSRTATMLSWQKYRAFYHERGLLSPHYYGQARAALAVIEPAVREDCLTAVYTRQPLGPTIDRAETLAAIRALPDDPA